MGLLVSLDLTGLIYSPAVKLVINSVLGPALGLPLDPQAAAKAEKIVVSSLSKLETVWLRGNGKFLLGSSRPSIADLSLVCEIMQLEVSSLIYRVQCTLSPSIGGRFSLFFFSLSFLSLWRAFKH